jgi:hypothetical protein
MAGVNGGMFAYAECRRDWLLFHGLSLSLSLSLSLNESLFPLSYAAESIKFRGPTLFFSRLFCETAALPSPALYIRLSVKICFYIYVFPVV